MKTLFVYVFIFLFLTVNFPNSLAQEITTPLKDITLVEHVVIGSYPTSEELIELAKLKNDQDSFLVITLPHRFDDPLSTQDTQYRGDIYCQPIQALPVLAVDGAVDIRDKDDSSHWPEVIRSGIQKHASLVDFSYYIAPNRQFVLKAKGTKEELKNFTNVHLNVIFFQNLVACNWENGDRMIRNLAKKMPLGPLGVKRNIPVGSEWEERFDVVIPEVNRQMYGLVAFLQDMDSLRILSSAFTRFADVNEPAYFSWKDWPAATYDIENDKLLDNYILKTGLDEMVLQVEKSNNLQLLQFEMNFTPAESKYFDILACEINPEIKKISTFLFDMDKKKVNIFFHQPIQGKAELLTFIVHWKKPNLSESSSFKFLQFEAFDTKNELLFFDLQDIRQYYPNMLLINNNPMDLSNDSWIDDDDLFLFLPHFGLKPGDPYYDKKFNLDKNSRERIDFDDFCALMSEIKEQYKIWKRWKELT